MCVLCRSSFIPFYYLNYLSVLCPRMGVSQLSSFVKVKVRVHYWVDIILSDVECSTISFCVFPFPVMRCFHWRNSLKLPIRLEQLVHKFSQIWLTSLWERASCDFSQSEGVMGVTIPLNAWAAWIKHFVIFSHVHYSNCMAIFNGSVESASSVVNYGEKGGCQAAKKVVASLLCIKYDMLLNWCSKHRLGT